MLHSLCRLQLRLLTLVVDIGLRNVMHFFQKRAFDSRMMLT